MGQLSDPYEQGEDDGITISLSGLPEDPDEPEDVAPELDDEGEEDEETEHDEVEHQDEVAYDLSEWEDDQLDTLFDLLDEGDVPYLWDGEELFIQATDEQVVDGMLEQVAHPHELLPEDDDGDAGGWLLGELFVVADRLQHDPDEHESVATLLQLADVADEASTPYGLGDPEWEALRERVTALATILEAEEPEPVDVVESARELRDATRPYV
jgi:hypothetical protein